MTSAAVAEIKYLSAKPGREWHNQHLIDDGIQGFQALSYAEMAPLHMEDLVRTRGLSKLLVAQADSSILQSTAASSGA